MFEKLTLNIVTSVLRHVVTAGGVWLVSQGYLQSSQQDAWLGSAMFLGGIALAAIDKVMTKKKLDAARS